VSPSAVRPSCCVGVTAGPTLAASRRCNATRATRWAADITELPTAEGKLYLAAIRDLCFYRDTIRRAAPEFRERGGRGRRVPGRVAFRLLFTGHHRDGLLAHEWQAERFEYAGAAFFLCSGRQLNLAQVLGDLGAFRDQLAS
jgi:hypothetical protein